MILLSINIFLVYSYTAIMQILHCLCPKPLYIMYCFSIDFYFFDISLFNNTFIFSFQILYFNIFLYFFLFFFCNRTFFELFLFFFNVVPPPWGGGAAKNPLVFLSQEVSNILYIMNVRCQTVSFKKKIHNSIRRCMRQ